MSTLFNIYINTEESQFFFHLALFVDLHIRSLQLRHRKLTCGRKFHDLFNKQFFTRVFDAESFGQLTRAKKIQSMFTNRKERTLFINMQHTHTHASTHTRTHTYAPMSQSLSSAPRAVINLDFAGDFICASYEECKNKTTKTKERIKFF